MVVHRLRHESRKSQKGGERKFWAYRELKKQVKRFSDLRDEELDGLLVWNTAFAAGMRR
jgi:hypothetical protein